MPSNVLHNALGRFEREVKLERAWGKLKIVIVRRVDDEDAGKARGGRLVLFRAKDERREAFATKDAALGWGGALVEAFRDGVCVEVTEIRFHARETTSSEREKASLR